MNYLDSLGELTGALYQAMRARVAQRPLLAMLVGALLVLWASASCVAQIRQTVEARSSAHSTPFKADAYRRYQDYEYVKRTGPITGPWYSSKW